MLDLNSDMILKLKARSFAQALVFIWSHEGLQTAAVARAMGRAEIARQVAQFGAKVPELASLQGGHFRNLVVGGGPAGYAVVSTLLDGGSSPTLWVDPAFQSGRLAQYLEVGLTGQHSCCR